MARPPKTPKGADAASPKRKNGSPRATKPTKRAKKSTRGSRDRHPNEGKRWSAEDKAELKRLRINSTPYDEIEKILGRTSQALRLVICHAEKEARKAREPRELNASAALATQDGVTYANTTPTTSLSSTTYHRTTNATGWRSSGQANRQPRALLPMPKVDTAPEPTHGLNALADAAQSMSEQNISPGTISPRTTARYPMISPGFAPGWSDSYSYAAGMREAARHGSHAPTFPQRNLPPPVAVYQQAFQPGRNAPQPQVYQSDPNAVYPTTYQPPTPQKPSYSQYPAPFDRGVAGPSFNDNFQQTRQRPAFRGPHVNQSSVGNESQMAQPQQPTAKQSFAINDSASNELRAAGPQSADKRHDSNAVPDRRNTIAAIINPPDTMKVANLCNDESSVGEAKVQ